MQMRGGGGGGGGGEEGVGPPVARTIEDYPVANVALGQQDVLEPCLDNLGVNVA